MVSVRGCGWHRPVTEALGLSRKRHKRTLLGDENIPGLGFGDSRQGWIKLSKPYQKIHLNRSILLRMSYVNRSDPRSEGNGTLTNQHHWVYEASWGWTSRVTVWMDSTGIGPRETGVGCHQRLLGCQDQGILGGWAPGGTQHGCLNSSMWLYILWRHRASIQLNSYIFNPGASLQLPMSLI